MKKIISVMLIMALLGTTVIHISSIHSYAEEKDPFHKEIALLTTALRNIFQEKQDNIITEIKEEINKKDYAYDLTMQSIEDPDLFKEMSCVDFIAAYMVSKKYCQQHKITFTPLLTLPILSYEMEEQNKEETCPVKVISAIENQDGSYTPGKYIYVTEPKTITYYNLTSKGEYVLKENQLITPTKKKINYGTLTFHVMKPEELFTYHNIPEKEIKEEYERKKELLTKKTSEDELYQSLFAKLPLYRSNENMDGYYRYYEANEIASRRVDIVRIAQSLIGKVKYQLGGKAKKGGYDTAWWTFEGKEQKGLDCSGFVSWVYQTYGIDKALADKISLCAHGIVPEVKPITDDTEMQIGDIGVYYSQGKYNHVGIYVGKLNGRRMYIHCASSDDTVVLNSFGFTHYYPAFDIIDQEYYKENVKESEIMAKARQLEEEQKSLESKADEQEEIQEVQEAQKQEQEKIDETEQEANEEQTHVNSASEESPHNEKEENHIDALRAGVYYTNTVAQYTNDDVILLAQLMHHEAEAEGLNGWIAVGEVVKNRLASDLFPNTIREVIYAPGQFSSNSELSGINPTEEMIQTAKMVLDNQISILNCQDVYYFRNPMITSGISANEPIDWGRHEYFTAIGHHAFYHQ